MTRTDEELVARAQGGDVESFNQLIVRWERPIYALAYRVIGREEDARDVCQDAFLRAYRALPGFKGQAKFSSWLYRIALNLCRDWIRRQRRAPVSQLPEDIDALELAAETGPVESIEDLVARRELSAIVEEAMSVLSEEQRTAIILKEYHGMTFQEIADMQGCPLSTVKTRLYQGLVVTASSSGATRAVGARNGETRMNDTFQCGDPGALVAYLYDECEPGERELIAVAHHAMCDLCERDRDVGRDTPDARGVDAARYGAWFPDHPGSGHRPGGHSQPRSSSRRSRGGARRCRPGRRPRPPLVIFAAGLSIGVARNSDVGQTTRAPSRGSTPSATSATATNVSRGRARSSWSSASGRRCRRCGRRASAPRRRRRCPRHRAAPTR